MELSTRDEVALSLLDVTLNLDLAETVADIIVTAAEELVGHPL